MGVIGGLAKGILGFFSIILAIIGIAFLAVAGVVAVEFRAYADSNLFDQVYLWGPVGVGIVLGILLLLIGIFGIGGICCEKKGMLKAFAVSMFLLIVLEITAAALVYVYRGRLEDELQKGIEDGIAKAYNGSIDTETQTALNALQEALKCCGGNGTQDYKTQSLAVPIACCSDTSNCNNVTGPYFTRGCTDQLQSQYKRYANIIFGIAIAFAVLEVLAIIYSCYAVNQDDSKMV